MSDTAEEYAIDAGRANCENARKWGQRALTRAVDVVAAHLCKYGHVGEAVYQKALRQELQERGFAVEAEVVMPILYKGLQVGIVRADLRARPPEAANQPDIIVELKKVPKLNQGHTTQLETYMRFAADEQRSCHGAVVNFGNANGYPEIHFVHKDDFALRRNPSPDTFECPKCDLRIGRDLNGAIGNFYAAYGEAVGVGWDRRGG